MRIFLIGFMGSGKSYSGKRLAEQLGWRFIDLDDWIETQNGQSIKSIFSEKGEKSFRLLEKKALYEMTNFSNVVIACGGGAPCFFDNMDWMNSNGLTFYLSAPVSVLTQRLIQQMDHRPILKGQTSASLSTFIQQKVKERSPFYEKAQFVIEQQTVAFNTALAIQEKLKNQ